MNQYNYMEKYLKELNLTDTTQNNNQTDQMKPFTQQKEDNYNMILCPYRNMDIIPKILKELEKIKVQSDKPVGRYDRFLALTNVYSCPRLVWFDRMKYQPDENKSKQYPYTVLMNEIGSFIHDYIAKLLGIHDTTSIYLQSDKYKVRGKCDGIIDNRILIEIKTMEQLPKTFDKAHFIQLMLLIYLSIKQNYPITEGHLIYIERNLKNYDEYIFPINNISELENFVLPYLERAYQTYEFIKNKQMPNIVNKGDCFFCKYHLHCDKEGEMYVPGNFDEFEVAEKICGNNVNLLELSNKQENVKKEHDQQIDEEDELVGILFDNDNPPVEPLKEQTNIEGNKKIDVHKINDIEWL